MSNTNLVNELFYKSKVDEVHAALTDFAEISSRHARVDKDLHSAISRPFQPITLDMKSQDLLLN